MFTQRRHFLSFSLCCPIARPAARPAAENVSENNRMQERVPRIPRGAVLGDGRELEYHCSWGVRMKRMGLWGGGDDEYGIVGAGGAEGL